MTSLEDAAPARRALTRPRPPERVDLTALDALALGAVLLVALLATASLALAHLGRHSLPGALGLTAALAFGFTAVARRSRRRVRIVPDRAGLLVAAGCVAVSAALTTPGFSYGVGDKDPGGYVSQAALISRTGADTFVDPILSARDAQGRALPVQLNSPGARLGGVWIESGDVAGSKIVPQFYRLWPALLATAWDAGGHRAMQVAVPVAGLVSVLAMVALLRRVGAQVAAGVGDLVGAQVGAGAGPDPARTAGLVAAGSGGLLLATNLLQVWHSRYPTTEVLSQALYLGALLGVVVALQTRWSPAAGAAGLLVGVGWLNRADGVLLVLLVVGVLAAVYALGRWDARAGWCAAGLGAVAPYALLQAYHLAGYYSSVNEVPSIRLLLGMVAGLALAAAGLRLLLRRPLAGLQRRLTLRCVQVAVGLAACAAAVGLLALGFLRARLFGVDYWDYHGRAIRSYDEAILPRLAMYLTLPGLGLMLLGLAVVALRRWQAVLWAVLLPTLVLFPVYAYTARNSTRMLWWTRRYVPAVLPGILVLVALALAYAYIWHRRGRHPLRVPAMLGLAGLLGAFLWQSVPLRSHDEWRGSFAITKRLSDLSGDARGVYLWEKQNCCLGSTMLFATPLWLQHGELSALLQAQEYLAEDPLLNEKMIAAYRKEFAGSPIFVVAASALPDGVDPAGVRVVDRLSTALPMWEELDTARPDEPRDVAVQLVVWRVRGT